MTFTSVHVAVIAKTKTKMSKTGHYILLKPTSHGHTTRKTMCPIYSSATAPALQIQLGRSMATKHQFCSIFFMSMVLLYDSPHVAGDISGSPNPGYSTMS